MKHLTAILCLVGLSAFFTGCPAVPTFPDNDAPAIQTLADLDHLLTSTQQSPGHAIKLAGRIVGMEHQAAGTVFSVVWLPYPARGNFVSESIDRTNTSYPEKRLVLLYPQKLDPFLSLQGNMFIAIGQPAGTKTSTTLMGLPTSVPHIIVQCIRVWRTGSSDLNVSPDTENTGYPPMAKTYCLSS